MIHNFADCLAYSYDTEHEVFWEQAYKQYFPSMTKVEQVTDITMQRSGIDRIITLSNGNKLFIDEKKRSEDYGDILLEYISNDKTETLGWIKKDLKIDYLAYMVIPSDTVYIFSWPLLRLAWNKHKDVWLSTYRNIEAKNVGYSTWSVAIPLDEIYQAITEVSCVKIFKQDF